MKLSKERIKQIFEEDLPYIERCLFKIKEQLKEHFAEEGIEPEDELTTLKTCPFCGGEVQLYNIDDGLGGFSYYYEVVCRHCGLSNKSIYTNRDRVENAAIKHWNTRPIENELQTRIKNALDEIHGVQECLKVTSRIDMHKILERIKYILNTKGE